MMYIKSTKKYWQEDEDNIWTRIRAPVDTLKEIIPIANKIGVTRVSDITHMDKLQIPNFSAVLPGTEDSIWVYSGKGPTKLQAMAGALMESIERYCSLPSNNRDIIIQGTYPELSRIYKKVLHPGEVVEPVEPSFNDRDSIADFVRGYDLITNEEVLVPAQLVFSKYTPAYPSTMLFPYSHTNGLASGNVLEEAICHALFEVIERDAVSIAELSASSIPYTILTKISNFFESEEKDFLVHLENKFIDDSSIFPDVDITEIAREFDVIKFLVERFAKVGVNLLVKNITQDIGIPTFVASSVEWVTSDYGYFAKGYGTHLDARIALSRAITELSQTRAANIQGARDDLKKIKYSEDDQINKRKWEFMSALSRNNINKKIMFSEIKTRVNRDIRDDINCILKSLKRSGLKRAIIVILTNPHVGIPVVRAVVPGLETFEVAKLYTETNLCMGNRARKHFRSTLRD
jgi:ribosomal protein S12 methylthiotransferase accessory factor